MYETFILLNGEIVLEMNTITPQLKNAMLQKHMYAVTLLDIIDRGKVIEVLAVVTKQIKPYNKYTVKVILSKPDLTLVKYTCECPAFAFKKQCKHVYIVLLYLSRFLKLRGDEEPPIA